MNIEDMGKEIEKYNTEKKAKKEQERIESQKRRKKLQKEEKKCLDREEKLAEKKTEIGKKILNWRDNFVKTKQFELLSPIYTLGYSSDGAIIYSAYGWGHIPNTSSNSSSDFSEVYLGESGELEYSAKHSVGLSIPREKIGFELDQNTIHKLSYDYLNDLYEHIDSGDVYDTLTARLKRDTGLADGTLFDEVIDHVRNMRDEKED